MKQYLDLIQTILDTGSWQDNRTGIRTISIPGAMMRFDLQKDGFPAVTTKRLAFKSVMGELVGFLRATRSAADFRALGCKVWDQNANENADWLANPYRQGEDDLGPVYGVQWRQWPAYKLLDASETRQIEDAQRRGFRMVSALKDEGKDKVLLYKAVDQLRECLDTIIKNPGSRRILFHGWNCADLDAIALPACHLYVRSYSYSQARKPSSIWGSYFQIVDNVSRTLISDFFRKITKAFKPFPSPSYNLSASLGC